VIRDVRGIGLMIGVEFDSHERAAAVEWGSFQRGLLVLEAATTVVRISPPLVITAEEAAVRVESLRRGRSRGRGSGVAWPWRPVGRRMTKAGAR